MDGRCDRSVFNLQVGLPFGEIEEPENLRDGQSGQKIRCADHYATCNGPIRRGSQEATLSDILNAPLIGA